MSRIRILDAKYIARQLMLEQLNYLVLYWSENAHLQHMEQDEYLIIKHEIMLLVERAKNKLNLEKKC
jgi:hypothetical protein